MKINRNINLFFLVILAFRAVHAQESPRDRGIALYKQGDTDQAIKLLEAESGGAAGGSDAEVWNYLGLAYLKKQEIKKGRLALEKAVKLDSDNVSYRSFLAYAYLLEKQEKKARAEADKVLTRDPKNVWAYYVRGRASLNDSNFDQALENADKMSALDSKNPRTFTLRSDAFFGKFIRELKKGAHLWEERDLLRKAAEPLRECLSHCKDGSEIRTQQEKLDIIEAFEGAAVRRAGDDIATVGPATEPGYERVKIISKARAHYTDSARAGNISGTIKAMILLNADGRVLYVFLLNRLGGGLDEEVEKVAKTIKFVPAKKNGRPVPVVTTVEYGFMIY